MRPDKEGWEAASFDERFFGVMFSCCLEEEFLRDAVELAVFQFHGCWGSAGQAEVIQLYAWPLGETLPLEASNILLTEGTIFLFNLVLSGFLLVTLTGVGFFVLPLAFLSFRAFLWGMLLNELSTPMFLVVFQRLILG